MSWVKGRRSDDYHKLKVFSFWRFDCYFIKYGHDFQLDLHIDEVMGFEHYRCNIQLRGQSDMYFLDAPIYQSKRIKIFRADRPHGLSFTKERGLMISFGWIKKEK